MQIMRKLLPTIISLLLFHAAIISQVPAHEKALFNAVEENRQWPSYRGYMASGYMKGIQLPDSFNVETGFNIGWKTTVPGLGLSCPVIWNDKVFVTTAVSQADQAGFQTGIYGDIAPVNDTSEHSWRVLCIDRSSGDIVWEREACRGVPKVKRHPKSSHANTSVATDGQYVVAFFGSEGLYCYDAEGQLLWTRDFGLINAAWNVVPSAEWEFSSSPLIFGDKLIVQADALNDAWVAVLDLNTGKTLWRQTRDEVPGWCTPNVYFQGSKAMVVLNGYKHRGAYDLDTGEEVWHMSGGGDIPVPTPVVWKDLVFFNSAHGRQAPLMAVHNHATGKLPYPDGNKKEHVAWFHGRAGGYMTSPVVFDSLLYMLQWNGNLACYRARTGEKLYDTTVHPASFIASPVIADGRIFMVAETGELYIAATGPEFRLLKVIPLGEPSLVTPAIAPGSLVLRTNSELICVTETE